MPPGKWLHVCIIFFAIISLVYCQQGHSCTTPNGDTATCMSVYECRHFVAAIKSRIASQLVFIKKSQCGFSSVPLVCCGPTVEFAGVRAPLNPIRAPEVNTAIFSKSSAIPDRKTCGMQKSDEHLKDYIIGGEETQLNEFPWMAYLGYTDKRGRLKWSCGGSIISSRYILTAAHCVVGEVLRVVGKLTYVKLGEHNVKTLTECDKNGYCNDPPVLAGVEQVIYHEDYDVKDSRSPNDIALIRLNQKLRFSDFIRPICLPELNESSAVGDYLTTAGWGRVERYRTTNVLLQVDVPYRENEECISAFRSLELKLSDSQLCAGGEDQKDSCLGDSGGPLMRRSVSNIYQWYQEGIVSFGDSRCGVEGLPGIYTRVTSFLPWIHSHVRD